MLFEGPLSCLIFMALCLVFSCFKLLQAGCKDSTTGKAIRSALDWWLNGKPPETNGNATPVAKIGPTAKEAAVDPGNGKASKEAK